MKAFSPNHYNPLIIALITGLALSLTACGGGSSGSSGNDGSSNSSSQGNSDSAGNGNSSSGNQGNSGSTGNGNSGSGNSGSSGSSANTGCPTIDQAYKDAMLKKVNKLRSKGRYCFKNGVKTWKNPAPELKWNAKLETGTTKFANDMATYDYYNYFKEIYPKYKKLSAEDYNKLPLAKHIKQEDLNGHLQPDTSKAKVNDQYRLEDAITFSQRVGETNYIDPTKDAVAGENIAWSHNSSYPSFEMALKTAYYGSKNSTGWLQSHKGHCETLMDSAYQDFAMSCSYNKDTGKYYFVQLFGGHG